MENLNETPVDQERKVVEIELNLYAGDLSNPHLKLSLNEKLEARKETIQEIKATLEGATEENAVDLIVDSLFRVQNLEDAIITELLQPKTTERERDLEQIALSWQAEAKKYENALISFRYQNRV